MMEPSSAFLIGFLLGGGVGLLAGFQGVDHAYRRTREVYEKQSEERTEELAEMKKQVAALEELVGITKQLRRSV